MVADQRVKGRCKTTKSFRN